MRSVVLALFCFWITRPTLLAQVQDSCEVHFYRPRSFLGSALTLPINIGGLEIELKNNTEVVRWLPAGALYMITKKGALRLETRPGGVYYVRVFYESNFWSVYPVLVETTTASGSAEVAKITAWRATHPKSRRKE